MRATFYGPRKVKGTVKFISRLWRLAQLYFFLQEYGHGDKNLSHPHCRIFFLRIENLLKMKPREMTHKLVALRVMAIRPMALTIHFQNISSTCGIF